MLPRILNEEQRWRRGEDDEDKDDELPEKDASRRNSIPAEGRVAMWSKKQTVEEDFLL